MIILRLKQQVIGTRNHFSLDLLRDEKLLRTAILENNFVVSDLNALCEKLQQELPEYVKYEVLYLPSEK